MLNKVTALLCLLLATVIVSNAQSDRWQQHINYTIKAGLNVNNSIINGTEEIVYDNNSTDTLKKVYFHLYWNAFQPNSAMDIRSRELGKNTMTNRRGDVVKDWDARVTDRIQNLKPEEIGYQRVSQITIAGKAQKLVAHETILEVQLTQLIMVHSQQLQEQHIILQLHSQNQIVTPLQFIHKIPMVHYEY